MKFLIVIILFFIADSYAQQTFNSVRVKDLRLPSESTSRALLIDGSGQVKASSSVSDTELSYLDGLSASLTSLLSGKEPTITGGTSAQYWRGDKTFQTLDKAAVGLGNVDNTSDLNKPISTATQTALNGKVGTTGNESISGNKTFTGKLITSTTSNGSIPCPVMTQTQRDAIVSPVEGDCVFNSTTDKTNVYSGTAWIVVGSGVGGINYITNFDFEIDASGWSVYADAAGTSPVDGTGGSASITFARTTSTPLRDTASGLLTKTAVNEQGEGFSVDFTVARADASNLLEVSFDNEIISGTYASGDIGVWVYDVTNAVLVRPLVIDLPTKTGTGQPFKTQFQGTGSTSYRLIFHIATTSASAYSIEFDNVYVSPSQSYIGSVISDWQSYTPTFTGFGAVTNIEYRWRRVGSSIEIRGRATAGTTSATEARVSFPSGVVVGGTNTGRYVLGIWGRTATSVAHGGFTMAVPNDTYMVFSDPNTFGSASIVPDNSINASSMVNTGESFTVNATFQVLGWSATQTVYNQNCSTDLECTDVFSAKVSSAGAVSDENVDWISSISGSAGVYTLTITGFTVAPNCSLAMRELSNNRIPRIDSVSSTQIIVRTRDTGLTDAAGAFNIVCQKQGSDYRARRTILGIFRDHVKTNGVERPVMYSAKLSSAGAVSDETGDWLSGNCSCSSGNFSCTFVANTWASTPNCFITNMDTRDRFPLTPSESTGSVSWSVQNSGGSGLCSAVRIMCHGSSP